MACEDLLVDEHLFVAAHAVLGPAVTRGKDGVPTPPGASRSLGLASKWFSLLAVGEHSSFFCKCLYVAVSGEFLSTGITGIVTLHFSVSRRGDPSFLQEGHGAL